MFRIVSLVLLAFCLAGNLAQESQESSEVGQGGGGGGEGGGGNANQPTGANNPPSGANNPPPPTGPRGATNNQPAPVVNAQGENLNPLQLSGRRLQLFNARLNFVRRELGLIAQTIGRFLFLGEKQVSLLKDELQVSLEVVLFPPVDDSPFPPLLPPFQQPPPRDDNGVPLG